MMKKLTVASFLEKKTEWLTTKDNYDSEVPGTFNEWVAQNWFRCFKDDDTSLEDKHCPWNLSVVEDESLREMVEQLLNASTGTLSGEICSL